jgi:hypothetical protein
MSHFPLGLVMVYLRTSGDVLGDSMAFTTRLDSDINNGWPSFYK